MMPKAPFLISPAYWVPPMRISWRVEVDQDDRLAARAVALGVGLEAGRVDDGEVGHEADQVLRAGPDEQVVAEDAGPGRLGVGAHRAPLARIGADEAVLHEQLALEHVVDDALRAARRSAPR